MVIHEFERMYFEPEHTEKHQHTHKRPCIATHTDMYTYTRVYTHTVMEVSDLMRIHGAVFHGTREPTVWVAYKERVDVL